MSVDYRVKVRMYRHGLGDCFVITLPRGDGSSYFIMIDCGVILGTPDAQTRLTAVVSDVVSITGGKLDLLLATHEHWDHLSGFIQAAEQFAQLHVEAVWLAWTEDPTDELAQKLASERQTAEAGLRVAMSRLQLAGDGDTASLVGSLLEFSGNARGGSTTRDAMANVRALSNTVRYCRPDDAPVELNDPPVRLYVLGPPRDERLIRKTLPSAGSSESYGNAFAALQNDVQPGLEAEPPEAPFNTLYTIPLPLAQETPFFMQSYWGPDGWRAIETSWLQDAPEIALQLDSATNNTCLVLAIELDNGDVLLFPGDAQVGNWESWQGLSWTVGDRTVTGPDLLNRTVMYKVGHHGSYNATLRENGLETMAALQLALVPVNEAMARQKHWTHMPLPALLQRLGEKSNGGVLRADTQVPAALPHIAEATELFYEIKL